MWDIQAARARVSPGRIALTQSRGEAPASPPGSGAEQPAAIVNDLAAWYASAWKLRGIAEQ